MITRAHVRDFQSIKDVEVRLDRFTVLMGPSNSGKSAFLRAIRACVRNSLVPANVRQGTVKSVIEVEFPEGSVEIERGKALSTYRLPKTSETFTKSGRAVPDEVAKVIQFPLVEGVDLSFSFQFDRPFLLSDPGSVAAQVIGTLTNASLLHAAVREANRRRQETSATLKVRESDLTRFTDQLQQYRDLPDQKRRLASAADLLTEVRADEAEVEALSRAISVAIAARQELSALEIHQPPDLAEELEELNESYQTLRTLTKQVGVLLALRSELVSLVEQAKSFKSHADQLEEAYDHRLRTAGVCPTCGQSTADHPGMAAVHQ